MTGDFQLAQVNIGRARAVVMRRRGEWFERFDGFSLALWWVPAGHRPAVEEAVARLFPPPGGVLPALDPTLEATCP